MSAGVAVSAGAVRFAPTAGELRAIARSVPGLTLPSFAVDAPAESDPAPDVSRGTDPRLLLALGLQDVAEGIVQIVSWSPGEVIRRTIAVSGVVAASIGRRDTSSTAATEVTASFDVALIPTAQLATELRDAVRACADGRRGTEPREIGMVASRAIVEAARHGDPVLVEEVAADLWVEPQAAALLQGFRSRQSSGFRVRCFDGLSGRCIAGDDWFGSEHGWRRLRLGLPEARVHAPTQQRLLDDATLTVAGASGDRIRESLTWLTATLLRVIAR
jgi:hypothetical protein